MPFVCRFYVHKTCYFKAIYHFIYYPKILSRFSSYNIFTQALSSHIFIVSQFSLHSKTNKKIICASIYYIYKAEFLLAYSLSWSYILLVVGEQMCATSSSSFDFSILLRIEVVLGLLGVVILIQASHDFPLKNN